MATFETSLEANYDGQTDGWKKRLIGAQATALPEKDPLAKIKVCLNREHFWAER